MPSLNYTVFIAKVENGTKRQTIRAMRKRPFKRGDRLHHFSGMRTNKCRRLRAGVKDYCKMAVDIRITDKGIKLDDYVTGPDQDEIARADGFRDFAEMLAWFKKKHGKKNGLRFRGQLIRW